MAVIVQKFGGTSLGSLSQLKCVAQRVVDARKQGNDVVVVVSAMAGETNRLLYLAKSLSANLPPREYASLVTTGEHVAMNLLTVYLDSLGTPAISYSGYQLPILTTDDYENADVISVETKLIYGALKQGKVVVIGGFQGMRADGDITTLGRGGSDTTAVAVAGAISADECQIFTDVDGIFTTDPRLVPMARVFECLSYEQVLAIAQFGAKVVQSRAVKLASKHHVPLRVLSSFNAGNSSGTLVTKARDSGQVDGLQQFSITYQSDSQSLLYTDVSIIELNGNEINGLVQKVTCALKSASIHVHKLDESPNRVCVRIDSAVLARCLCILHSQLGMDG